MQFSRRQPLLSTRRPPSYHRNITNIHMTFKKDKPTTPITEGTQYALASHAWKETPIPSWHPA
jgi:hypothetical protein